MKLEEIKRMLNIGSRQHIIYEAIYDPDRIGKSICSLLNSGGGIVAVSITNEDKYTGLSIETEVQRLELALSREISPRTLISFSSREIESRKILIIEVPEGKEVPYSYKNDIFVKIMGAPVKADVETIKDMIVKKQNEPIRWERRFSDAQFDEDFDEKHFKFALNGIKKTNRIHLEDYENVTEYLDYLSLYKYGQLTNGGDVLFCKNPAKRLPQIRAKAVLFANDKTDSRYIDMKDFEGPLLIIYKELSNFIERNTPTAAFFPENDPKRKNISLYPERAVREGLINALAHRDYSSFSGSISVSIYPNRMEIWNYGEFPNGVSVKSLDKGNVSVLRNPDIAHVLYLQDFMEKLGRGALTIKTECKAYGLPEPHWKNEKGKGVTLTFFAPAELGSKPAELGSKPAEKENAKIDLNDLTKQDKILLEFIKLHKQFVLKEIEKFLDVRESRAREIMRKMTKRNIVRKIQQGKNTYYVSAI